MERLNNQRNKGTKLQQCHLTAFMVLLNRLKKKKRKLHQGQITVSMEYLKRLKKKRRQQTHTEVHQHLAQVGVLLHHHHQDIHFQLLQGHKPLTLARWQQFLILHQKRSPLLGQSTTSLQEHLLSPVKKVPLPMEVLQRQISPQKRKKNQTKATDFHPPQCLRMALENSQMVDSMWAAFSISIFPSSELLPPVDPATTRRTTRLKEKKLPMTSFRTCSPDTQHLQLQSRARSKKKKSSLKILMGFQEHLQ